MWTALVLGVCLVWDVQGVQAYTLKTTKTGQRVRWSTQVITLYVDAKLEAHYGKREVNNALTIATEAWRGLERVPDVVVSDRPASGYQADARSNGVYLMMPWPFAREQLAVTVSTYDLEGHMIGADILVNGESDYALLDDASDVPGVGHHDLAAVLTHEVGHVLGLDESADDQSATMWPYIRGGDVHQRTLSEDDERGITAAYADMVYESELPAGCTQASVLGARPEVSKSQLAVWFFAALLVAHRLSRRQPMWGRLAATLRIPSAQRVSAPVAVLADAAVPRSRGIHPASLRPRGPIHDTRATL
ncbi:MAG: matrixin family metalloprotease [Polyangiales bacterium]